MKKTTKKLLKALILLFSMVVLIWSYLYMVFWSNTWKWKFWVSGKLDDLLYIILFTFVWGSLIKYIWKLEVRLLF